VSLITDVAIIGDLADEDHNFLTSPLPREIDTRGQFFLQLTDDETDQAGGSKFYCTEIHLAAFNYVSPFDLMDWMAGHKFSSSSEAIVVINYENDDSPRVYHIARGRVVEMRDAP
jgi:hypothetical protein